MAVSVYDLSTFTHYTGRDQRECLLPLEARLRKAVGETNALRTLAAIPLLCAAVCALNRARNGFVPEDRLELYQAFCAMLLERREKEQGLEGAGISTLSLKQKMELLQDLAYWMMLTTTVTLS